MLLSSHVHSLAPRKLVAFDPRRMLCAEELGFISAAAVQALAVTRGTQPMLAPIEFQP